MPKKKESKKKNEDEILKKKNTKEEQEVLETVEKDELEQAPENEINKEIELQETIDQLNDKYLRLNAEYQNYRKRVEKEKADIFKYGTEKLFIELLPIMDNFERALSSQNTEKMDQKILDGIVMIKKSFESFFDKNGVKKIEALGQPFDPVMHHAVMTESVEDSESEHVVEVLQDGYLMNDKVIRTSMVKVSN
ncbi:MAG: nucleotide exchange factor GrpE [Clostridiales bacterium]|nr:nucleotide exchange factor GrpE [Clostridiales bacterium]